MFFLGAAGQLTELSVNATTAPLIPNVSAEMWMRAKGVDMWVGNGMIGDDGKTFIWGSGTLQEETYDLDVAETSRIRYVDLENYTRMDQLKELVGVANSLADQRKPSGKKYTSKPLVSVSGDEIQGEHGENDEVHRNMLLCLRFQHGLVASNSYLAAEQLSAIAMLGLATGVYPGPKIETEGQRGTMHGTYDTPFIFATDGHIAGGQPSEGALGQLFLCFFLFLKHMLCFLCFFFLVLLCFLYVIVLIFFLLFFFFG